VLEHAPAALMLSFGDPRPFAARIRAAGAALICQVQSRDHALAAIDAGASIIVAQGTEAGGHGAVRSTLPLVPAIADLVARRAPEAMVVAAGGIADGRGLAAALMLGAEGVLVGTRFYACAESLGHNNAKARLVAAGAEDTLRTSTFDIVRGYDWPENFTGRALRNDFTARWHGREAELAAAAAQEMPRYRAAVEAGDFGTGVIFVGEAADLIGDVPTAADLVSRMVAEAETALAASVKRIA
jgi:nitronate monooxygenase